MRIAALLHDVGHAPFSHTSEAFFQFKQITTETDNYDFFKNVSKEKRAPLKNLDAQLINQLIKCLEINDFENNPEICMFLSDYSYTVRTNYAKPHEKMSALVALRELNDYIISVSMKLYEKNVFDPNLFIRCITGTKYRTHDNEKKYSLLNLIIGLLNSEVIDVDKLDYILRDSYMSGFKSSSIDIERLINSFTIILEDNKRYYLAYRKNALSVIENVLSAGDAVSKWVINHPTIVYDTYLTQRVITEMVTIIVEDLLKEIDSIEKILESPKFSEINELKIQITEIKKTDDTQEKKFSAAKGLIAQYLFSQIFSVESLTENGIKLISSDYLFLLSDSDLQSLFKKAYVISNKTNLIFTEFYDRSKRRHPLWKSEQEFNALFNQVEGAGVSEKKERITNAIQEIINEKNPLTNVSELIINKTNIDSYRENASSFLHAVQKYFDNHNLPFDILIANSKIASSKLAKLDNESLFIKMKNYSDKQKNYCKYSKIVGPKEKSQGHEMFYLFSKDYIDSEDFVRYLLEEADF